MTTDFSKTKVLFDIPKDVIYLDGNSLGPLPIATREAAQNVLDAQWGTQLISAWNQSGWMDLPSKIGDMIAPIIGAKAGTVTTGDTLSIKVHQALHGALGLNPNRKIVLSDSGNFPTDLYIANALLKTMSGDRTLKIVSPEDVLDAITDDIAVIMLTQVDYRTGRMHDMKAITQKAHAMGAVIVWDLAHSAGAVPLQLTDLNVDFAIGCTYKFLNGGPGAPAFIYVRPDHIANIDPTLAGWMGHDAPFAFDLDYRPAASIERMRVGTPPIIQLRVLEAALGAWQHVDMADIRTKSIELSEQLIAGITSKCPELKLASPTDPAMRGSQVSFEFEHAYPLVQALVDNCVIGDFRAPNIARFGITPLYLDRNDIEKAVEIIARVVNNREWDKPEFHARAKVT